MFLLTGKEYNRMATKRTTMNRMRRPRKSHLNLRHTMNFMVLHGLVNQKKEVSGRLLWIIQLGKICWILQLHLFTSTPFFPLLIHLCSWNCKYVGSYLGGSSFGFMLGSSRPFPAGFSSTSASPMISSVISTLPYTHVITSSITMSPIDDYKIITKYSSPALTLHDPSFVNEWLNFISHHTVRFTQHMF